MTRRIWGLVCAAAVAVAAACGEGRAIFNVDVLSFIGGQGNDSVPYAIPGGSSGTVDNPPVKVTLLKGLGNSTVDSVSLAVGATVENRTDSGKVKFQIFFSSSQANVYAGTPYAQDSATVRPGADTVTLAPGPIPLAADSIFGQTQIYVGVRVSVVAFPGPQMTGTLRLSKVLLRIVLQDHIFH
jgi:hypothetical protein